MSAAPPPPPTEAEQIGDALTRLEDIYRPLDDLWSAQRDGSNRDAYHALGYALCALDDAREGLERATAAYAARAGEEG